MALRISVIVPVYKVKADLLKRCVDSILNQMGQETELIIVLDGEDDAYSELFNRLKACDDNLKIEVCKHAGVSSARNRGMQIASGEWIFFADADDWIEPGALARLREHAEKEKEDIVMGEYVMEYGDGMRKHIYRSNSFHFSKTEKSEFINDVLKPQTGVGFVWGKLFRRSLLMDNGIVFDSRLSAAEDAEFMFRAACAASSVGYIQDVVYHYWYNPDSAVRLYHKAYAEKYIDAMRVLKADIEQAGDERYEITFHNCVLYHLLLIAVNYTFHPGSGKTVRQQMEEFKKTVKMPIFQDALSHIRYKDFSFTRKAALFCIRIHFYAGLKLICMVRHFQFKQISKKE